MRNRPSCHLRTRDNLLDPGCPCGKSARASLVMLLPRVLAVSCVYIDDKQGFLVTPAMCVNLGDS